MTTFDRSPANGHANGGSPRMPDGPLTPPQNLEAEQSVLGAVLLSDTALPALIIDERLRPDDFYREAHGVIFAAMLELHSGGQNVDALTLVEHLKQSGRLDAAGGRATVDVLAASVPAVGHLRQYARIVRENAMLRRLLRASYDIQARVHSHDAPPRELVDIAERTILEVAHEDSRKDFRAVHDVLFAELDKLEKLSREGKAITGTPSGFEDLDTITGGFQPGNLIILAARPSMGKCLAGGSMVYDAGTGARRRIDEVVAAVERGEDVTVASLSPELRLRASAVTAGLRSGIQPVYRLTTRLGRRIDATATHPLYTFSGWRAIRDLRPGDEIAVPRRLPQPHSASERVSDVDVVLLAALIADGNRTSTTPRFCYGGESPLVDEVRAAAGRRRNHSWHVDQRKLSRPLLRELSVATHSSELECLAASDIRWDAVASIVYLGEQETFDLTVDGDHNFVADDVIVHNSALMANFAENAALGADKAVALFSLEMSESELAQRFIASQASIKGDDLRKGRVPASRWGKIMEASNRLAKSPLFIDDSSDLSVLDVRAKARRLLQQHADGLGLILIDYLQLMRADGRADNRVEQIGQISRGLKTLARELDVPVIALSQLNRGVEQRTDKRPVLSDLRESGCLTAETRVYLPDSGEYHRIDALVGRRDFRVMALNTETWKLEPCGVSTAFGTGRKPVHILRTQSGRRIRATANHRFLTIDGWRRLDAIAPRTHIALPRRLSGPSTPTMPDAELALLGHLIGDGCTLTRHAIQYTTREPELASLVSDLAVDVFGDAIAPITKAERRWHQVYLRAAATLARGRRNPVTAWLDELGAFGLRSHEKHVPQRVFNQPFTGIARFLRHLWATDGCVWHRDGRSAIYFATSSERLAGDVQSLLLRLGVTAALRRVPQASGRDQFHVRVSGTPDMRRFLAVVGTVGARRSASASDIARHIGGVQPVTNRDVAPAAVRHTTVRTAMASAGFTERAFQSRLGTSYCGTTLYRSNLGRERAARVAEIVGSDELSRLADSDVYWDRVVGIEPDGEEEVYDLTVDRLHNFVAEDVVVHNSIEQDADLVMFIYRDEYYDKESEREGIADVIISKHRNGGLATVELTFQKDYPRFMSYVGDDRY